VPEIRAHKGQQPVVCLTCYHAHTARLLDSHVDIILVGDSLGMVMHGLENTLGVTLDMMITHGKAVMRGSDRALVVVDMPFGSYEESPEIAFRNAARIMQETGCTAVKLEGGTRMAPTVHYLTQRGIPVCAHVGLLPQASEDPFPGTVLETALVGRHPHLDFWAWEGEADRVVAHRCLAEVALVHQQRVIDQHAFFGDGTAFGGH
jgi:hypothetical protein